MKKRVFLVALLATLALTSCDMLLPQFPSARKKSSNEDESGYVEESNSNKTSSRHVHKYGQWMTIISPTCTEEGLEERQCECGETQTRYLSALGHDYSIYLGSTATCQYDGYESYRCSRCGTTTSMPAKADHQWGGSVYYIKPAEDYVSYYAYECLKCNWYQKIEIRALDGTFAAGSSNKSGTPDGYMKLASNNQSISWMFDLHLPRANGLPCVGMLYQRACMDSFSSNLSRTYGSYSTSSTSATREEGNFTVTVNGAVVDKTPYINLTYEEMLSGGEVDPSLDSSSYSPVALCPIGEILLNNGTNKIIFQRTGSFNLTMSDLVMIVQPYSHTHIASSDWSYDENYHWHGCLDQYCPVGEFKADLENHNYGSRYDEVAATCTTEGSYKQQCRVCGYVRTTVTAKEDHQWVLVDGYEVVQPTKTSTGYQTVRCSVCGISQTIITSYGQTKETALTVDEALEIGRALEVKEETSDVYYVKGTISQVVRAQPEYNRVTLWLSSSMNSNGFEFYNVSVANGVSFDDIVVGAEVYGYGKIHRYKEDTIEFNGTKCYLYNIIKNETVDAPLGSYQGSLIWAGPIEQPLIISITDSLVYVRFSTISFYGPYSYDSNTSQLSINSEDDNYGIFTATYRDGALVNGSFNGSLSQSILNNGTISLSEQKLLYNCNGTTEELQSIFKRRYRPDAGSWVVDTNNADRITSEIDFTMGSCLRIRPYSNGAIALNLAEDLATPLECNSFGFWVYNPSANDITLRIWMYKGTAHSNNIEISSATALAGQWTYCYSSFTTLSTYNFQIADFTNSGVALRFDNISFSLTSSILNN